MPELPDIVVAVERLELLLEGAVCRGVRLASPFWLRSVEPPLSTLTGLRVTGSRRLGKRIVLCFEDDVFAVQGGAPLPSLR